jgi:hypothetical protein
MIKRVILTYATMSDIGVCLTVLDLDRFPFDRNVARKLRGYDDDDVEY